MRTLLLTFIVFFFGACASLSYTYQSDTKSLNFKLSQDKQYQVFLEAPNRIFTNDACTNFSYILKDASVKYDKIFIEHIALDSSCRYNGSPLGYFTYEFKEHLKLKSFKKVEEVTFKNYEFFTYEVNGSSYMSIIHYFGALDETFIVDYKGVLSQELIQQFDANYKAAYINKERFYSEYSESLVRKNIFNHYFNKESSDFSR